MANHPADALLDQIREVAGEHCYSYAFVGVMPGYETDALCCAVQDFNGDPAVIHGLLTRALAIATMDVRKDVLQSLKQPTEESADE